jgi:hypothetical protein
LQQKKFGVALPKLILLIAVCLFALVRFAFFTLSSAVRLRHRYNEKHVESDTVESRKFVPPKCREIRSGMNLANVNKNQTFKKFSMFEY